MHVRDFMTRTVHTCSPEVPVTAAAHLMQKFDVGSIPVVDENGQPIAMITDRDICLAVCTQGRPLEDISVASAMSKGVFTCRESATVAEAERTMRDWQVLRLPVVNAAGRLVGIVSLSDIVRRRAGSLIERGREWVSGEILDTLLMIGRRRRDPTRS